MTGAGTDESGNFGALLHQYRVAAGLSQEELADRAGLSAHGISDLERGARTRPYPATIRRLAAALALSEAEHTEFQSARRRVSSSRPLERTAQEPGARLPEPLTSFIGRDREVAALGDLLMRESEGVRLITLIGPAGTGKTRLAIRVAAELDDKLAERVWFVPLSSIRDPGLVVHAIARALGLREAPSEPLAERLVAFLRPQSALLVLDNFEQILAAAPMISNLLAKCPGLKVLVTSRAPLRLYGEREFLVPPLGLPDSTNNFAPDRLMQAEAVRLFVERARAVQGEFSLTDETGRVVAEICRRLDGLPLAIELAASRSKVLSPRALLARLGDRLSLLTTGSYDLPPRQRTLRAALDWSYDLLSHVEQTLFRRLGVFVGGCTVETAMAICNPGGDLGTAVLDGLTSLVDQNLIQVELEPDGEPRFLMLESIHEYAWEHLVASAELRTIRRQHAHVFLGLAQEAEAELRGPRQTAWRDRLDREMPNLRTALRWSLDDGDLEPGLRAAAALWMFWFVRGHLTEGRQWLETLLQARSTVVHSAARAKALFTAGILAFYQRDHAAGLHLHDEGLALQRQLGDREGIAYALFGLAQNVFSMGDLNAARALHEEALGIRRELGNVWDVALSLLNLGLVVQEHGDHSLARALIEESLALRRQLGDRRGTAGALVALARLVQGLDDYTLARSLYSDAQVITLELDDTWSLVHLLAGLASLTAAEGKWMLAMHMGAAAASAAEASGTALFPGWLERMEHDLEQAQQALGPAAVLAISNEGGAGTVADLVAAALAMEPPPRPGAADLPRADGASPLGMHATTAVPLTRREREVAVLIARGYTNREIATALVITARTAAAHVEHILRKLGMTSRAQVGVWAALQDFAVLSS